MKKSKAHKKHKIIKQEKLSDKKIFLRYWCSQDKSLQNNRKKFAEIIKMAILDDSFKDRLSKNPQKVLKEQGIKLRKGLKIQVIANTKDIIYLMIPYIVPTKIPKGKIDLKESDLKSAIHPLAFQDDYNHGDSGYSNDGTDKGDPHNRDNNPLPPW